MDFINNLIKLGGTPTVLCGAFIISFSDMP